MKMYEFYTILVFFFIWNDLYFLKCLAKDEPTLESFVNEKVQSQQLLCLYTFDLSENSTQGLSSSFDYLVSPREYEERCPFGGFQYDPNQVEPLDYGQLGIHVNRKISQNVTMMIKSTDSINARQFSHWLLDPSSDGGYTFELVFRRRHFEDQAMTLLSIMSGFEGLCGNTGLHIEMDRNNGIVVAFPVLHETEEYLKCRELVFKSAESSTEEVFKSSSCTIPPLGANEENTPVIHLTVTIARSSCSSKEEDKEKREKDPLIGVNFYLRYTDPMTMEENTCDTVRYTKLPSTDTKLINQMDEDHLRLLIGQTIPLKSRKKMYSLRQVPLELIRKAIRQQLHDQISNSSLLLENKPLPKLWNFRFTEVKGTIFGDELFSIKTPTAYVKDLLNGLETQGDSSHSDSSSSSDDGTGDGKSADEKRTDKLVEYLMEQLDEQIDASTDSTSSSGNGKLDGNSLLDEEGHLRAKRNPLARVNGTKTRMDLFVFAMYNISLSSDQVEANMAQYLIPSKSPLVKKKMIHIADNTTNFVRISLDSLDSVYNKTSVNVSLILKPSNATCIRGSNIFSSRRSTDSTVLDTQRSSWSFGPNEIKEIWFKPCKKVKMKEEKSGKKFMLQNGVDEEMPDFVLNVSTSLLSEVASHLSRNGQVEIYIDGMEDLLRPVNQTMYLNPTQSKYQPVWLSLANEFGSTFKKLQVVSLPRHGKLYDVWEIVSTKAKNESNPTNDTEIESILDPRVFETGVELKNQHQIKWIHLKDKHKFFSTELVYVYYGWQGDKTDESDDTLLDYFTYRLVDEQNKEQPLFSEFGYIYFKKSNDSASEQNEVLTQSDVEEEEPVAVVVDLKENTLQVVSLLQNEPLYGVVSNTTFTVVSWPTHGQLYQYVNRDIAATSNVIGQRMSTSLASIVQDPLGRVVYVSDLHYHNTRIEGDTKDFGLFDSFTFKMISSGIEMEDTNLRRINLRVLNMPTDLVFLPPFQWKAPPEARRGDNVSVSLLLNDPDALMDIFEQDKRVQYHVEVRAIDGFSEFMISQMSNGIIEEMIMTACSLERPCWVPLVDDQKVEAEQSLSLLIKGSNWNPSHFELKGNLIAIQQALKQVTIRDWSLSDWDKHHVCAFQVSATRKVPANSTLSNSSALIEMEVVYLSQNEHALLNSLNQDHIGQITNVFSKNFIFWMIFVSWFLWFVLLYAGCACGCWCDCLCCCCLSRHHGKKRQRYKQKAKEDYELFKDKVVQTDEEYNVLLYHVADLIFEPDLDIVSSIYRCICLQGSLTSQIVAVKSLLILLETEQQGLRFVAKLLLQDLARSPTSANQSTDFLEELTKNALGCFCRMHTDRKILIDLKDLWMFSYMDSSPYGFVICTIQFLQSHSKFLPVEIIIIFRLLGAIGSDSASTATRRLGLVHKAFFYFFLGPILCEMFEVDNANQEGTLYQIIRVFFLLEASWHSDSISERDIEESEKEEQLVFQEIYEDFLHFLLKSSTLSSSFVPDDQGKSKDPRVLGLCMMNLHSLLDQYMCLLMLEYNERPRFDNDEDDMTSSKPLHNLLRLKELVDALSLPFVGCMDDIKLIAPPDWYRHRQQLEVWRQDFFQSLNEPNDGRPSGPQDTKIMKQSYFPSENDDHVFEDLEIGSCSITPVYNGSHDTFCVSVQTNAPYTSYRQPSNEF